MNDHQTMKKPRRLKLFPRITCPHCKRRILRYEYDKHHQKCETNSARSQEATGAGGGAD